MKTTLLAIGDNKDWDSFLKFRRQGWRLKKAGMRFVSIDYESILDDRLPTISTDKVVVFLFFPFEYWDKHIEPKKYNNAYGNRDFYVKLKKFWKMIDRKIASHYKDKKILYINAPENIPTERDKEITKRTLAGKGLSVPRSFRITNCARALKHLNSGKCFFIKPRFGSMGKGITYLSKSNWYTNFGFRNKRITNRHSDYGWKFRDVTGNKAFLSALLKEDMIIEEAIPRWLIDGKHFDIRCLLFFGEILYIYPRSNTTDKVTTNVSQGASSETMSFLDSVPVALKRKLETTARKAAKALDLNFAGVDLMLDPVKKEVVVIELNSFPGFPKMKSFNLAKHIIDRIGKRKWK